jgi:hypothetical protein
MIGKFCLRWMENKAIAGVLPDDGKSLERGAQAAALPGCTEFGARIGHPLRITGKITGITSNRA